MPGYQNLGLVQNPFGSLTEREREQLAIFDPQPILKHIQGAHSNKKKAVRFMGEKGRGKSTRLRAISRTIPEATFKRLSMKPAIESNRGIGIFDEFQRAHIFKRRKIYKNHHTLILSTHLNVDSELQKHGFSTLKLRVQDTSPSLILEIIKKRVEYFSKSKIPPFFEIKNAKFLKQKFGDDMRTMMRFLYYAVQDAQSVDHFLSKLQPMGGKACQETI